MQHTITFNVSYNVTQHIRCYAISGCFRRAALPALRRAARRRIRKRAPESLGSGAVIVHRIRGLLATQTLSCVSRILVMRTGRTLELVLGEVGRV